MREIRTYVAVLLKMAKAMVMLLLTALLLTLPLIARADVLVEPRNDFHSRNRHSCRPLGRRFYANGESGSISLKTEPGSNNEVEKFENGKIMYISHTYNHNGDIWGLYESPGGGWLNGWIPLEQLLVVYDYISFREDFEQEIYIYNGSLDTLIEAEKVVLWTWPGSGEYSNILGAPYKERSFDVYFTSYPGQTLKPHAYRDDDGREWVFTSMKYLGNNWVCVNEPTNSMIPAFNPAPEPELWLPGEDHSVLPGALPLPVMVITLVAVLLVITVILIGVFWRKSKAEE